MTTYETVDLKADPVALATDSKALVAAGFPGWSAERAHLEALMLEAFAYICSQVVRMAGFIPVDYLFRIFGQRILRVAAFDAVPATGAATFHFNDASPHTIDEGSQIVLDGQGFETMQDATGTTTVSVAIVALDPGAAGNNLTGTADARDTFSWLDSVTVDTTTGGGSDGETDAQYQDRLADETPTLGLHVVNGNDAERLARRDPDVVRALAIEGYVPGPPILTGIPLAMTVFVHGTGGSVLPGPTMQRVEDSYTPYRLTNLSIEVAPPTVTNMIVEVTINLAPGADQTETTTAVEAAVRALLAGDEWGRQVGTDATVWQDTPLVMRNDVIAAVYQGGFGHGSGFPAQGVQHVVSVRLARQGNPLAAADLTLDGPAALPNVVTVTVIVA